MCIYIYFSIKRKFSYVSQSMSRFKLERWSYIQNCALDLIEVLKISICSLEHQITFTKAQHFEKKKKQ